jgi:hypothetical protein
MSDPNVRVVGDMQDHDGMTVIVGVDYGTVTIEPGEIRLSAERAGEFAQLLVRACWEAARQAGDQR